MIHPPLLYLIENKNLLPADLAKLLTVELQRFPKLGVHIYCLSQILKCDLEDLGRIKAMSKVIERCSMILSNTNPTEQSRFGIADQLKRCKETTRSLEYNRKLRLLTYARYLNLIKDASNETEGKH